MLDEDTDGGLTAEFGHMVGKGSELCVQLLHIFSFYILHYVVSY